MNDEINEKGKQHNLLMMRCTSLVDMEMNHVDLPSLREIKSKGRCFYTHRKIEHVVLEGMELKSIDSLDIPNLQYENIDYGGEVLAMNVQIESKSITLFPERSGF